MNYEEVGGVTLLLVLKKRSLTVIKKVAVSLVLKNLIAHQEFSQTNVIIVNSIHL